MDAILQGLSGIFEVVLIAGLGFYLAKTGWLWETAGKDLTRLTMTVALPPLMIYSLKSNFTHDQLIETAPDLLLPFASIFAAYLAGRLLAAILHISPGRRGVFTCTCCIANALFIGLPVNVALFGEKSVPSAMLYYIANTAMFWGLGAYLIVKDAGSGRTFTFGEMMKKLRTPPLMGFVAGVVLVLLDIPLPSFALTACRYVGNMATPMALMVVGIQMSEIPPFLHPLGPGPGRRHGRPFHPLPPLPLAPPSLHSHKPHERPRISPAVRHAGHDKHDHPGRLRRRRRQILHYHQLPLPPSGRLLHSLLHVSPLIDDNGRIKERNQISFP